MQLCRYSSVTYRRWLVFLLLVVMLVWVKLVDRRDQVMLVWVELVDWRDQVMLAWVELVDWRDQGMMTCRGNRERNRIRKNREK